MDGELSSQQPGLVQDKAMRITRTVVSSVSMLFGLAAVLALSIAVIMWAARPEYSPIAENITYSDVASIASVLTANNIDYKVDNKTGKLLVANDQKQQAMMLISAEGLPNSNPVGYELLKKDTTLGTSQFLETARYQHALETELSRSIASMRNIESARVHLAIPKRTAFMRKKDRSSASVMIKVAGGRQLQREQVNSIAYLVASSVAYLEVSDVTVVDQWGNLLNSSGTDKSLEHSQKQLDYKKQVESIYVERIESMLAPIFGFGRIKVQVNAEMDFTRIESTQELFDSDEGKIRSEQIVDQQQTGALNAMGIPGALTNQPPAGGTVEAKTENDEEQATVPTNTNRNTVRNYELDKTIRHIKQPVGALQRITVAVVADDWVAIGEDGTEVRTQLTEEDLSLIRGIVREAIGFNEGRGDSVSVYNKTFQKQPIEELPAIPVWQESWFISLVKQIIAGIAVLILIFTVIKPAMKTLQHRLIESGGGATDKQLPSPADQHKIDGIQVNRDNQVLSKNDHPNYVEQLAMAKQLVNQDSKQVAKVVKNWVSGNG